MKFAFGFLMFVGVGVGVGLILKSVSSGKRSLLNSSHFLLWLSWCVGSV